MKLTQIEREIWIAAFVGAKRNSPIMQSVALETAAQAVLDFRKLLADSQRPELEHLFHDRVAVQMFHGLSPCPIVFQKGVLNMPGGPSDGSRCCEVQGHTSPHRFRLSDGTFGPWPPTPLGRTLDEEGRSVVKISEEDAKKLQEGKKTASVGWDHRGWHPDDEQR